MQYNLIRNGYFTSLTASGTGNVDLTWAELEFLMDGNLTSSGVSITSSGVLCLETDLSQRIKVDGIRLYTGDLSKSANIKFYYKNAESDSYTIITTHSGASYYYATMDSPSAPQFIRVTVSGVDMDIYEFQVFNDDYIVSFGQDGSQYAEYLDNTPVGEIGAVESIAIYNNSTSPMPANAYTCIDYTGNIGDNYIEIGASSEGPFYSLSDGVLLEDNLSTSKYIWNAGEFSSTEIVDGHTLQNNFSDPAVYGFSSIMPLADETYINGYDGMVMYAEDRDEIYVVSKDASVVKLFRYDLYADSWTYIGEIAPGETSDDYSTVSFYHDGYIYVFYNRAGTKFGRYNLDGPQDNWESLTPPPLPSNFYSDSTIYCGIAVCKGELDNFYLATTGYYTNSSSRNFFRYDTTTSGWTTLSNAYDNTPFDSGSTMGPGLVTLTYDTDRNVIYLVATSEYHDNNSARVVYIQRYSVDTNSWQTSWLAICHGTLLNITSGYFIFDINYDDGYLYVSPNYDGSYNTYIKRYNISTATWDHMYVGDRPYYGQMCRMAILPSKNPSVDRTILIVHAVNNDSSHYKKLLIYGRPPITKQSGTYISPIFIVDEADKASYFIIDGETDPATGSISCDSSVYNGTIQHRATNTEPLHDRRILWSTSNHDSHLDVRYLYSNTSSYSVYTTVHNNTTSYVFPAVNRWNGLIAICNQTYTGYPGYLDIVNPSNYAKISSYSAYDIGGGSTATWAVAYSANIKLEFDIENGLWGYGNTGYANNTNGRVLFHMRPDHHYASYLHYEGGSSRIDFLYDLAVVSNGTDAWYTHKIDNVLKRISTSGNTMVTINGLVEPRAVCASHEDNGCWVWDTNLTLLYQYSEEGEVLKTLSASELGLNKAEIWRLDRDFDEGIWLINSEGVGHINEYDKIDLFIEKSNLSRIRPGHKCCAVYSYYEDYVAFVDLKEGSTTSLWTTGSTATHPPALMDVSYEDLLQSGDPYNLIPVSYDPVWNNSFDWTEVPKDGYFLPKLKYHQVKLTLWGDAKVNKIIMAPPVKLEDIQPLSYRNLYIRTNIPVGTDIASYETKLKTWWGMEA